MSSLHEKRPYCTEKYFQYRGRFAPSPSGFLHFGSLITALASFLDAKSFNNSNPTRGKWLLRIEDIDPPREQIGASSAILTSLDAFGLHWDETELYQSKQSEYYHYILTQLKRHNFSYYCHCSRANIKAIGGIYQGHCRQHSNQAKNCATRLTNNLGIDKFVDIFQGKVSCNKKMANEDFIIHRRDGLFAYQLAVVADDIAQNITHVVRGCDLLEPTSRQITLFNTMQALNLCYRTPQYGHVPLAVTKPGYKLSKQNRAPSIDNNNPQPALILALQFLGQQPPAELIHSRVTDIIEWACQHWQRSKVPKTHEINLQVIEPKVIKP